MRDFRIRIFSRFAATIASQLEAVIVGWQVYSLTHDPLSLGLVGLSEAIPAIGVALYAGHITDRYDRRRVLLIAQTALLFCVGGLIYLSFTMHDFYPKYGAFPIYIVIFASGLASGFISPASFALSADLIPEDLYANASAWNSSTWQTGAIVGPALGGVLYGLIGLSATYTVDFLLVLVAIVLTYMIRTKRRERTPTDSEPVRKSLLTGLRFVFKNQYILGSISLDLFAVLFGGAVAMLPVFAKDILKVGPEGLGALRAAPSVGAVLIALAFAHRPLRGAVGKQILWTVAGFGITIIFFAISKNFWLSLVLLFFSGALDSISVIIRSTVIQILTPSHMRGRVGSVNSMFIGTSNEIGAFESGVAAKLLGTVPSVLFGGAMTLVTVFATALLSPKLRRLQAFELTRKGQQEDGP